MASNAAAADATLMFVNYRTDNGKRQSNRDPDLAQTVFPILVPIHNGRKAKPSPRLATHGFELLSFGNSGRDAFGSGLPLRDDYLDDTLVRQILYPWCEAVIKHVTGASVVKCFHHLVRGKATSEKFAPIAHSDYTTRTAYELFNSMPSSAEGGFKNFKGRYAVLNVWKNINPDMPIANHHLAMCDGTTVAAPDDFLEWDNYKPPTSGISKPDQSFNMTPNNHRRHKWYYFPLMTSAEAIVFMQYDSDCKNVCRYTFHSSVADPSAAVDFPRESIEMRVAAWFPDPNNNTLPDFSVAPEQRIPAAVAAVRDSLNHFASWDLKGKDWVVTSVRSGDFSGIARGICTHGREEGNRGVFKDLSDNDIRHVVSVLAADSAFALSLIRVAGVNPEVASHPVQVEEACQQILQMLKSLQHWDQKGKMWIQSCVNLANFDGIARALSQRLRTDANLPKFSVLTDGDIGAIAKRLALNNQLEAVIRSACPSICSA